MNDSRYHSVRLDEDKCRGCTACLKRCPVEAIRVYDNKAHIINERCIDCGECIRVCEYHAKVAHTDTLEDIRPYAWPVALLAPSLYGQFRNNTNTAAIRDALLSLGFKKVFDVARGADVVARAVQRKLKDKSRPRPLISSACPAVTRLIQARFRSLIPNIISLRQPMEVAAAMARREAVQQEGVAPQEVGIFFITPCPAKKTAIHNPIGHESSQVDGAISMMEIYGRLQPLLSRTKPRVEAAPFTTRGMCWAAAGGEIAAVEPRNSISVDGIDNVIRVLEAVEDRLIDDLDYLEALACLGGCIGGPLIYENNYLAKNTLDNVRRAMEEGLNPKEKEAALPPQYLHFDQAIPEVDSMKLHESIAGAMERMEEMNRILDTLPGYDCGSCGSPTCRSFAEDIVKGLFSESDCIYVLKDTLKVMAQKMVDIAKTRRE